MIDNISIHHWLRFLAAPTKIRPKLMTISSDLFIIIQNDGDMLSHITTLYMIINVYVPLFIWKSEAANNLPF